MKNKTIVTCLLIFSFFNSLNGQDKSFQLTINLSVSKEVKKSFFPDGRLFIFLNNNRFVEPRTQIWPSNGNYLFAGNISGFDPDMVMKIDSPEGWIKTPEWGLDNIPEGEYYVQVLWDQDNTESRIDAPGNIYSEKQRVELNKSLSLDITLYKVIEPREIIKHPLVREITFKSDTLSKWWGKPVYLKASVLLPGDYSETSGKAYPIRYNVAGYGGRYNRINSFVRNKATMEWWQSEKAPRVINVFLDGEGPFGDSYQIDSDNSGPYGYSLIYELIPYIESTFRGTNSSETRFVDGCSTGGWVSLALQLFYPDFFNGAFSYSPDPVDFENFLLVDIYRDNNAFVNEHGYIRPIMRDISGEPIMSVKDFIQYENVLGASDTYLNSGGQFSAHTALYSPKGNSGLPVPLIDPITGDIDHKVAEHWEKYDLKKYAEKNWETLGPKVQGKIFIWMGDMDNFYLNLATRSFYDFIRNTTNPRSDAEIIFTPMQGHCSQYSYITVLEKIAEKLKEIEGK